MRVTFIGFGEVAAAFAAALVARGAAVSAYDVLLESPDGLDRLRARAGETGVDFRTCRRRCGTRATCCPR